MFSVVRLLLENSQNSAVKGLGRDSYVTKSHSNVWVLRSQMGLSQDQLLFAFFFLLWRHWNGQEEHCTFGLGIVLDLNTDLRCCPFFFYEPVCACWQSDREISECMSSRRRYKVQSTDRKCGRLTGRKALIFYCAGAKREFRNGESREDKTGERRRGGGRSRADRLRNEHWLSERVSVRKAQWLVGNL